MSESTLRSSRAKGGSGLATSDLTRLLDDAGIEYELLPHAHTESAAAEAEALGLAATDVAKTLVVKTPEGYVRAVLPASERLDLRKLREFLGVGKHDVHLATEDDLRRDFPEFELGATPPVGGGRPDPVLIERRLVGRESLVLEAGSHEESIRIAADDFVRVAGAGRRHLRGLARYFLRDQDRQCQSNNPERFRWEAQTNGNRTTGCTVGPALAVPSALGGGRREPSEPPL